MNEITVLFLTLLASFGIVIVTDNINHVKESVFVYFAEFLSTTVNVLDADIGQDRVIFTNFAVPLSVSLEPNGTVIQLTAILAFFDPANLALIICRAVNIIANLSAVGQNFNNTVAAIEFFPFAFP